MKKAHRLRAEVEALRVEVAALRSVILLTTAGPAQPGQARRHLASVTPIRTERA